MEKENKTEQNKTNKDPNLMPVMQLNSYGLLWVDCFFFWNGKAKLEMIDWRFETEGERSVPFLGN